GGDSAGPRATGRHVAGTETAARGDDRVRSDTTNRPESFQLAVRRRSCGQAFRRERESENLLHQVAGHLRSCRWRPAGASRRPVPRGTEVKQPYMAAGNASRGGSGFSTKSLLVIWLVFFRRDSTEAF